LACCIGAIEVRLYRSKCNGKIYYIEVVVKPYLGEVYIAKPYRWGSHKDIVIIENTTGKKSWSNFEVVAQTGKVP
jgi:hypothetical protein